MPNQKSKNEEVGDSKLNYLAAGGGHCFLFASEITNNKGFSRSGSFLFGSIGNKKWIRCEGLFIAAELRNNLIRSCDRRWIWNLLLLKWALYLISSESKTGRFVEVSGKDLTTRYEFVDTSTVA